MHETFFCKSQAAYSTHQGNSLGEEMVVEEVVEEDEAVSVVLFEDSTTYRTALEVRYRAV